LSDPTEAQSMWKTALIVVVVLATVPLAGFYAGVWVGDATCKDPPGEGYPDFRCLNEVVIGGAGGFTIGALAGVSLSVALVRRYRRSRGRHIGTSLR
jgi:hypothetical protein